MPKFFVEEGQIYCDKIVINGQDVNHIKNVLRKNIGDNIIICDKNKGQDYLCEIFRFQENEVECKILDEISSNTESNVEITIYQGIPKADKMEYIIQKAVELGAKSITPTEMKRCIVKLKDTQKKLSRWQKIAEVASKQSGRNKILKINNVENINEICSEFDQFDLVIVAYEEEKINNLRNELLALKKLGKKNLKIGIVIGPEGGIDKVEVEKLKQNGAKVVTLGKRILRTETASLNILSIIMYELENREE